VNAAAAPWGLADTSLFIALETGRPVAETAMPDQVAVSVVTLAELRAGVLAARDLATRARRLATLEYVLRLDLVPIDAAVADAWAVLRVALRDLGRSMKVNDAWIAATAIALGVPVVTQDDDFSGAPLVEVVRV
jgi:predicted nucleic acid-binding protein